MAGEMEILFSLAGRTHVILRREINRIIDVEWMIGNMDYAHEVLKIARSTEITELHELALRIEEVHPLLAKIKRSNSNVHENSATFGAQKYVHTLR